jgi:hypothetical protein
MNAPAIEIHAEYRSLLSRWILQPFVDRQFLVPLHPLPVWIEHFLKWYERRVLDIDVRGMAIDRPIFLIGLPRSGTTLLQDILCTHPDVAFITNVMNQFPSCFCAAEALRRSLRLDFRAERYVDGLEIRAGSANEGMTFFAQWFGVDLYSLEYRNLRAGDFTPGQVEGWMETIRRIVWSSGGTRHRFFNKNPGLLPYMLLLNDVLPSAKFIHLVRDPRLCANSMIKLCHRNQAQEAKLRGQREENLMVPYPRLPNLAQNVKLYGADDIRTTAHLWDDAMTFVARHSAAIRFFHTVRHEDIVANPRHELSKILEFCELREIDDPNAPFWREAGRIGVVPTTAGHDHFERIAEICRSNMDQYGYGGSASC